MMQEWPKGTIVVIVNAMVLNVREKLLSSKLKTRHLWFFCNFFFYGITEDTTAQLFTERIIFHPIRNEKWQLNFKEYKELHLNQNDNARFFENNNEKGFKENMEIQNPILSVVNTSEKLEIYQIWIF